jgi:ABC-2 type transport system permease protein
MSVSEEKENRVIEIVLSTIKSKSLIFGKIIGQVAIVVTQVLFLLLLSLLVLLIFKDSIPIQIDLGDITITLGQILLAGFYAFLSFFILACTMVGVGAAMPNYKDAQSFSSIFIFLSIIPIYFVTTIIADPTGTVARVLSYLPFTNGIVLLFRSTLGALTPFEIILSGAVLILYAVIAVFVAFRLFEIGSLEYSRKITLKEFKGIFKRK